MITIALVLALQTQGDHEPITQRQLVIAGGGSMPDSVFEEFRAMAGDKPRLVVIPTASSRPVERQELSRLWKARGFESLEVLHAADRKMADREAFVEPLRTATAVWFGGGSQQRIADAYLGTRTETEIYNVLKRGGVVGGTSAGAAIQTKVMIASGHETPKLSTGLNLLPNAIVDQHFLKRNRIPRLMHAVRSKPKLTGFGIDEGTALIVENNKARVAGRSYVLRISIRDGRSQVDSFDARDAAFVVP